MSRRGAAAAIVALTLVPPAVAVLYVARYHVDIPFWDQWPAIVPLLAKLYGGGLSWNDLWAQHNEYRPIFPRLVWLALARASGWSISAEMTANLVVAGLSCLLLLTQVGATLEAIGRPKVSGLWPILTLVVFSTSQWENWLNGFQLLVFMNVLAMVTGVILLARPELGRWGFLAAVGMGVVATYTMTSGMVLWPVGLVLLLAVPGTPQRRRRRVGLWLLAALAAGGLYFVGYEPPPWAPPLGHGLGHPLETVRFVLDLLGAPLLATPSATVLGLLGVLVFFGLGARLARQLGPAVLLAYAGMGLYATGSAVLIGIGRVGYGSEQALISRYITVFSWLWVANLVWLWLALPASAAAEPGLRRQRALAGLAIAGITGLVMLNGAAGARHGIEQRARPLAEARRAILAGAADDELLERVHPDPDYVRTQLATLQRLGLWIYRPR
jgi:hypothetical protein